MEQYTVRNTFMDEMKKAFRHFDKVFISSAFYEQPFLEVLITAFVNLQFGQNGTLAVLILFLPNFGNIKSWQLF